MHNEAGIPLYGGEARDRRLAVRQTVLKSAKIIFGQSVVDCRVVNVSNIGVQVRTDVMIPVPERVTLRFNGGAIYAAIQRWALGTEIGFAFDGTPVLAADAVEMAWRAHELVRKATIGEPLQLLRVERFFDDPAL